MRPQYHTDSTGRYRPSTGWCLVISWAQASDSSTGGFVNVSDRKTVTASTTFSVDTDGKDYGYYMVWLKLPTGEGQAEINEVTAKT